MKLCFFPLSFRQAYALRILYKTFDQCLRVGRLGVRGDKSVDSRAKPHRHRRMDAPDFIPLFGL